jgi:hypothetical protein
MSVIKIVKEYSFSKVGINEVVGLKDAMARVVVPIVDHLKQGIYWDDGLGFEESEYRSRDGFMAYSHNCGGLELCTIIPKCEEYDFGFLEFGECDTPDDCVDNCVCSSDEGHLDAKLRVWLKFEGISDGVMSFYLVLSGGNGDAPYFREKYSATYFEESFEAKSLLEFETNARGAISRLIAAMPIK